MGKVVSHGFPISFSIPYPALCPCCRGTWWSNCISTVCLELSKRWGVCQSKFVSCIGFPIYDHFLPDDDLFSAFLGDVPLIPIITAGLRAVLIEAYPHVEQIYPTSFVIIYGLLFTSLLLLIYIPTHIILSEAGKQLRDNLCPLKALDTLVSVVEKRKSLDELLQINVGVTQNLKSGFFTLTPLVSSLVVSLLGINI